MRHIAAATVIVILGLAAGCSSPPSHFYTLSRIETPAPPAQPASLSVVVGPVSIPAIVDQPQIVVSTGPNQVSVDEFNRWASPLQNNIARSPKAWSCPRTPHISLFQQSLNAEADFRVAIEVQSFESAPGEGATLNAVWLVRRTRDGKAQTGRTTVREPVQEKTFDAVAAAHSRALARLSRDIADAVGALDRSR